MTTLESLLCWYMREAELRGDMAAALDYMRELGQVRSHNRKILAAHPALKLAIAQLDSDGAKTPWPVAEVETAMAGVRAAWNLAQEEWRDKLT